MSLSGIIHHSQHTSSSTVKLKLTVYPNYYFISESVHMKNHIFKLQMKHFKIKFSETLTFKLHYVLFAN